MPLVLDLKFALRALAKRPGFSLVAIALLAVGIGANTAVFSVVQAVLLRPLPVHEPERLVAVWEHNVPRGRTHNVVGPANFLAWRERAAAFESLTALTSWGLNLSADGTPERVQSGLVWHDFLSTLGVAPALGRGFRQADAEPGEDAAVILSDGFWKRRFGGDPDVLGRSLTLNGETATVIGVMPAGFAVPPGVELWTALPDRPELREVRGRYLLAIGRLKPGVSVAEARAELEGVAARLAEEHPDRNAGWSVTVAPLHADLVRDARPAALVLFGAVALVLLIACANLATLLLARAVEREREIAVRRALGASPGRLLVQLLSESLLVAVAGGLVGLALAGGMVEALLRVVPAAIRELFPVGIDARALVFTLVASSACALAFGLAPAWSLTRGSLVPSLREGSAGAGASRQRRRLSRWLVGAEVALSAVLLVGAALLLRSFDRLSRVDPGFDATGVLSFDVSLTGDAYAEGAAQSRFFEEATQRLATLPGVRAVGAMSWRPIGTGSATSFTLPDRPAPPPGQAPVAAVRIVTPDTFQALGIPLRQGRSFSGADDGEHPSVVIVNEGMAREFWPGEDPIGKRAHMEWGGLRDAEVVGVVGDARLVGLDTAVRPTLYWSQAQLPNAFMTLLVRTDGDPSRLIAAARARLAGLDPTLPLARVGPLEAVLDESLDQRRFVVGLIGAFAAVASVLAGLGLFGVLSCTIAQRIPELGVRLALGALPADVRRLVLREGLLVALAGGAAGLGIAFGASELIASLLYEIGSQDPLAFGAVALLLALLSLAAAALPALRAGSIDPARALRDE